MGYASADGTLTEEMIDERVDEAVAQHKLKMDWLKVRTPSEESSPIQETSAKSNEVNAFNAVKRHWE